MMTIKQCGAVVTLAVTLALTLGSTAQAATFSGEADADTWVGFSNASDFGNRESDAKLETQGGMDVDSRQQRAIMAWDLSSIPGGSVITSATLMLRSAEFFNDTDSAINVEVRHIVPGNPWTEGGATWQTYDGTNNWTNTGVGGTSGSALLPNTGNWLGSTSYDSVALPANSPAFSTFGTDPVLDVTGLVQQWVDGTLANNGLSLAIASGVSASDAWLFLSNADNATPGTSAFLTVQYIPEPASLGLLGLGVLMVIGRRRF